MENDIQIYRALKCKSDIPCSSYNAITLIRVIENGWMERKQKRDRVYHVIIDFY